MREDDALLAKTDALDRQSKHLRTGRIKSLVLVVVADLYGALAACSVPAERNTREASAR